MQNTHGSLELPARTHPEAAALFRRPEGVPITV